MARIGRPGPSGLGRGLGLAAFPGRCPSLSSDGPLGLFLVYVIAGSAL